MAHDSFGDSDLTNDELVPVPVGARRFSGGNVVPFWLAVCVSPGMYAFAVRHEELPRPVALGALAAGLVIAVLLSLPLTRGAVRYGTPLAVAGRTVGGYRGGIPFNLLRWLVGIVWLAVLAADLGEWLRKLLWYGLTNAGHPVLARSLLKPRLPGTDMEIATWLIGGALLWWVSGYARIGMWRLILAARRSVGVVIVAGLALVVYAGQRTAGFGPWLSKEPTWHWDQFAIAAASVVALTLPGVLAAPDWTRYMRHHYRNTFKRFFPAALTLAFGGVILATVGALLAASSHMMRGGFDGAPIPDAAGFAGIEGGILAVVFSLGLWVMAAPTIGLYSPAISLSSVQPLDVDHAQAVNWTAWAAFLIMPGVVYLNRTNLSVFDVYALAAPLVGVYVVDEMLLRRGKLVVEEAYLYSKDFGPHAGVTLAALGAFVVGLAFHPLAIEHVGQWAMTLDARVGQALGSPFAVSGGIVLSALVAGLIYLFLAPVERHTNRAVRKVAAKAVAARESASRPRMLADEETSGDLTNPNFDYDSADAIDLPPTIDDDPSANGR